MRARRGFVARHAEAPRKESARVLGGVRFFGFNARMRTAIVFGFGALGLILGGAADEPVAAPGDSDVDAFVQWMLAEGESLENVRFAEVVEATSGRRVLPVDPGAASDRALLAALRDAMDGLVEATREAGHPIHAVGRVNEISGSVEKRLEARLDATEGVRCAIPPTASGTRQRSGYPDLRLEHAASGRVFYLDPKVFREGSEDSGFRTFYFEPQAETNKILEDASHLVVGVAHGGKREGEWRLASWRAVDLADFRVRLKAEFQASNEAIYRPAATILRSGPKR